MRETWVRSLVQEDPLEKEMVFPTPVFLPGESHGWRSLVGYSPRSRKESDTTERLHFTSLQYSCLGNPMDGGACRVTGHRVTKSWTQLSADTHIHTHTHAHEHALRTVPGICYAYYELNAH